MNRDKKDASRDKEKVSKCPFCNSEMVKIPYKLVADESNVVLNKKIGIGENSYRAIRLIMCENCNHIALFSD